MKRAGFTAILLLVFAIGLSVAQEEKPAEAPRRKISLSKLRLDQPRLSGQISLEQALAARRSVRDFTKQALTLEQVGQLAWAGQGITEKRQGLRSVPSAGGLYPISLYFVINGGVYVYHPGEHSLEKLVSRDLRTSLSKAANNQKAVARAACDIVIAGSEKKLKEKYREKARTFMLLEAGHVAQNIHLQAVCLGLASVPVGEFNEKKAAEVCRLPEGTEALYIISVGYSVSGPAIEPAKEDLVSQARPDESQQPPAAGSKRAVFVIIGGRFRYAELFNTQDVLQAAGTQIITAAPEPGFIQAIPRGGIEATMPAERLFIEDYDAVIFVTSSTARKHLTDVMVLDLVRDALARGKIVGAIGTAVRILANAGVLEGVPVTGNPGEARRLVAAGAQFTGAAVEWDGGLIITAAGSDAAGLFGRVILDALTQRQVYDEIWRRRR